MGGGGGAGRKKKILKPMKGALCVSEDNVCEDWLNQFFPDEVGGWVVVSGHFALFLFCELDYR